MGTDFAGTKGTVRNREVSVLGVHKERFNCIIINLWITAPFMINNMQTRFNQWLYFFAAVDHLTYSRHLRKQKFTSTGPLCFLFSGSGSGCSKGG